MSDLPEKIKNLSPEQVKSIAVMNVEKGEEIVGMWATVSVPGTGVFKLLAKKRVDGIIEWAHYIHREDSSVGSLFRGEVKSEKELSLVKDSINKTIAAIVSPGIQLQVPGYNTYTTDGTRVDKTKN